jgi:hypothetical protein
MRPWESVSRAPGQPAQRAGQAASRVGRGRVGVDGFLTEGAHHHGQQGKRGAGL